MIDEYGNRKYLDKKEILMFTEKDSLIDRKKEMLCVIMTETGCRISESLNLISKDIGISSKYIRFETLKKRRKWVFRSVPVSATVMRKIDRIFGISKGRMDPDTLIWPIGRMTAYRCIRQVMESAGIYGIQACPRGLRHGFAVSALNAGVPITLVQRWLGHADLKTTAIYTHVLGAEERAIASRMWTRRPQYKQGTGRHTARKGQLPGRAPSHLPIFNHYVLGSTLPASVSKCRPFNKSGMN